MPVPTKPRPARELIIYGCIIVSFLFAVSFLTAPWDVWAESDGADRNAPLVLADVLLYAAIAITLVLVVIVPLMSPPHAWIAAGVIPLPFLIATLVWIEGIMTTNPHMNMAGVAFIYPVMMYMLAFVVACLATPRRCLSKPKGQ